MQKFNEATNNWFYFVLSAFCVLCMNPNFTVYMLSPNSSMSGRTKNKPEIRAHHVAFAVAVAATIITIIIINGRINVPSTSFFLGSRTSCSVRSLLVRAWQWRV